MTWFWTGPEDRGLSEQSVAAYLATGAARELATGAIARQHAPTDGRRPTALERARIDGLVDTLGLAARLHHRPHELSGGQQQRVAIARALATAPDLVFADEPTGNLDSRSGREVLQLLATASSMHGQSIAMVTHDPVAASYADRVLFLGDGRIVADKPRQSAEQISAYMLQAEAAAA